MLHGDISNEPSLTVGIDITLLVTEVKKLFTIKYIPNETNINKLWTIYRISKRYVNSDIPTFKICVPSEATDNKIELIKHQIELDNIFADTNFIEFNNIKTIEMLLKRGRLTYFWSSDKNLIQMRYAYTEFNALLNALYKN